MSLINSVQSLPRLLLLAWLKPVWASAPCRWRKSEEHAEKRDRQPPLPPAPAQCTKADCGQSICGNRILVLLYPETKRSACLSFGGHREPHQFPGGGFSGEEKAGQSCAKIPSSVGNTLGLSPGSGLHVQPRRNCISIMSMKNGWLLSREAYFGPGYMASGLVAVWRVWLQTRACLCLSSVMPASWRQVGQSSCTWPRVLKPASERALAYMGRPMETSQSDTMTRSQERGASCRFLWVHHLGSRKTKKAISSRFDQCHRRALSSLPKRRARQKCYINTTLSERDNTMRCQSIKNSFLASQGEINLGQESVWVPESTWN